MCINYYLLLLGYKKTSFGWETIMVGRKTVMMFIAVFFAFDFHIQGLFGLIIMFVATLLQVRYRPFVYAEMNHLELMSLLTTSLTFFCGQFTFADLGYTQNMTSQIASYMALGINCLFLLVCFVTFIWIVLSKLEHHRTNEIMTQALDQKTKERMQRLANASNANGRKNGSLSGLGGIELVTLPSPKSTAPKREASSSRPSRIEALRNRVEQFAQTLPAASMEPGHELDKAFDDIVVPKRMSSVTEKKGNRREDSISMINEDDTIYELDSIARPINNSTSPSSKVRTVRVVSINDML